MLAVYFIKCVCMALSSSNFLTVDKFYERHQLVNFPRRNDCTPDVEQPHFRLNSSMDSAYYSSLKKL
jgi:hypothetical protein